MRHTFSGLLGARRPQITRQQAKAVFLQLPRSMQRCDFTSDELQEGMQVEFEHWSVTHGSLRKTAMIAAAHLCEPGGRNYYKELKKLERKLRRNV